MKKTLFTALRAMCVGAMTLFAVSCYDDSALREDLAGLEDEVAGLAARLDSLENVLNDDVKNLNELESAMADLEEALAEALQESGVDLKKAFEQELADIEKELAAAIAKGDQANADALAAEKKEIEDAMLLLAEGFAEGFTTMGSSVEELAAALAALNTVVGNHTELLKALDEKDGVLDGKIADLEAAVAALTTEGKALQAEVAKALAKVSVTNVEKTGNTIVITFSDGNSVELSAPLANVDNNGLVNIVEVDGVKYWNVIGADTHTGVVVGHPDVKIEFQINGETNELEYKVNNGEWISTGVSVEATAANVKVITAFEETEEYVKLTIGGTDVVLPKYTDFSAAALSRAEAYFAYGVSKTATLEVVDGCEAYVISKPDGWKANLADGVLTVTAPSEELVNTGAADENGLVLVHVNSASGACTVLKFEVTAGPAMSASYSDGNLTFFTTKYTAEENWDGSMWYEWVQIWAGLTPVEEFFQYDSFASFLEENQYSAEIGVTNVLSNILQEDAMIVEGVREELSATISMTKLLEEAMYYGEFDSDKAYVMWFVPNSTTGYGYALDEAIYIFVGNGLEVVETDKAYNNVSFEATFAGADAYFVGASSKSKYDDWGLDETYTHENALMQELIGSLGEGPLTLFNNGDHTAMGEKFLAGKWDISLSDIMVSLGGGMGMMPMPGGNSSPSIDPDTEYFVWVLPYYANKSTYTFEDLMLTTCKTAPLSHDPAVAASVEITSVDGVVSYTITPSAEGAFRYEWMAAEQFEELYLSDGAINDEAVVEALGWMWASEEVIYEEPWGVEPGQKYVLLVYSTANGCYGITATEYTVPVAPSFETPDLKQWITASPENAIATMMGTPVPVNFAFDLGVSVPKLFPSHPANTLILGMDYFAIYGESEEYPQWVSSGIYGTYTVEATDKTSGVIYMGEAGIPYSNYTGTTCTFDFSAILGQSAVVDFVLVDSEIDVYLQ